MKIKRIVCTLLFLLSFFSAQIALAKSPAFVSIVNPVRGNDFWDLKNQKPETAVLGQIAILQEFNLPATWLLRFDALSNEIIVNELKNRTLDEKGLFLEITPSWADQAKVSYHKSVNWHAAGSAFLTGYERGEREKLIDKSFEKFREVFGLYPKSVGAWWIDSYSLDYMQKKYGIISGLIVADQYTTDNYQIWGQYFGTPYYPAKNNALHPAQSQQDKIPVVLSQWALRDPVNGYGSGVFESTFSVQPNDYIDYHKLGIDYFSKLVNIYTEQEFNQFGSVVVGLENTYDWSKYGKEYKNQISVLRQKNQSGLLNIVTLSDFASWYQKTFPQLSPEQIIVADDPLGSINKVVWFMNPYFRAGWFYNQEGSVFRDIRQYVEGEEEICFQKSCNEVNFATFATRVLDEVTYGQKWVIDEGKISSFKVLRLGDRFILSYLNEAGNNRTIEFLPRDISVNGKISSIDGTILDVVKQDASAQKSSEFKESGFSWTIFGILSKTIKFLLFLLLACLIPGLVITHKLLEKDEAFFQRIFLGGVIGSVALTMIFYITSILNLRFLVFLYVFSFLLLFCKLQLFFLLKIQLPKILDKLNLAAIFIIILGTVFQNIPTFKNGLIFPFGMGFWGPNTHDGIWHISLINQLLKGLPVENPIYADTILKNYHFFYDLLIAAAVFLTRIPIIDLFFRFFPVFLSLLLGIGTYYLVIHFFANQTGVIKTKIAAIFSLYFVYFAGSFGWIVEYIKQKTLGGESAFWANQSISFNLNPPFAISLLIITALFYILLSRKKKNLYAVLVIGFLIGSLVGFKAYGAVLILSSLAFIAIINILKKEFSYFLIFLVSLALTLLIFLSNFESTQKLIAFSPFWFIHSMIDSPDRVGWIRLTIARTVGLETHNWFKFISAEVISLVIFILGNLGMRSLSLFSLTKTKSIVQNTPSLFILVFSVLAFLIPILFIQSGNPWNTIQFSYYGLYTTAVISGFVLMSLIFRLPKIISVVVILPILILTPINSITTATYYTGFLPHGRIDLTELEALTFLSTQKDGTVLTIPFDKKMQSKIAEPWPIFAYDSTAYVSAISKKAVYLEDEPQNQILLTDYKKRLIASKNFFLKPVAESTNFLQNNHIKYIYLPKIYNTRLDESANIVKNIFENSEVIIYQIK